MFVLQKIFSIAKKLPWEFRFDRDDSSTATGRVLHPGGPQRRRNADDIPLVEFLRIWSFWIFSRPSPVRDQLVGKVFERRSDYFPIARRDHCDRVGVIGDSLTDDARYSYRLNNIVSQKREVPMTDYLQPVGDGFRRFAAVACLVVAIICATLSLLAFADMAHRQRLDHEGKPLWAGAAFCGLLAIASGWICARLWTGRRANRVTVMPIWFIEVFGALLLAATLWVAREHGILWGGTTGIGVCLSMLFIRRAVRHRLAAETESEAAGTTD